MIFALVVGGLVALIHLYLWKRLVKDTTEAGRARRVGGLVLAGLAALVALTLVVGRLVGPGIARWFAWPGFVWFGLMAYLFLVLAVLELPRLALRGWTRRGPVVATAMTAPEANTATPEANTATPEANTRRVFLARGCAVAAGVASAGLVGAGMVSALGPPEVTRLSVPLRRLDPRLAGFRIAVVSDIHLGSLLGRGHTERIVHMINETEPDLVAIVGDLVDGTVDELGPAVEPLQDLVSGHGTYFVTGNHEYYSGYEPWMAELERLGVQPLRNERTGIQRGDAGFDLAGINDVNGRSVADGPDLDRALAGRDPARPVVLLAHQPVQVAGAAERGVDLQLSGHTHGGQLYPFHHVVRLVQPSLSGLSKVDDTWLYVTRGAGFWGPPVRVGAAPEISVVELR
ncbi:MAG TPA: metallophosphoesterase [Actinophytocola sp.]|uniref:metallophosphoesterase n=1 Tax=Actinophytocola sp. TaxID=1872138 RepID=UPI002DDD5D7B|nr:metallophosphoesterase [Actinophytocola sp.]HEV2778419.1 metallophosphoesterase [Actinophytocola sp.]